MSVADIEYERISVGTEVTHEYAITPDVYEGFLGAFGDRSPVHVDDTYARERGYESRVMHGSILNGFVSHFVGMRYPGRRSLLLSVDLRYANPSYLGDDIRVRAAVTQKSDAQRVVVLTFVIDNVTRGTRAATGRAQVRVAER